MGLRRDGDARGGVLKSSRDWAQCQLLAASRPLGRGALVGTLIDSLSLGVGKHPECACHRLAATPVDSQRLARLSKLPVAYHQSAIKLLAEGVEVQSPLVYPRSLLPETLTLVGPSGLAAAAQGAITKGQPATL